MAIPEARKYSEEEFYALGEERVELIDGYVVDKSPTPDQRHQRILGRICRAVSNYIDTSCENCDIYCSSCVKLAEGNIVAPDLYVTCSPDSADEQQYLGAPDWIIEIVSPSTVSADYYDKMFLYIEHGVKEYWIVDPIKNCTTVHVRDGEYIDVDCYWWEEDIPVYIYKDKTPPLTLNIAELLGESK